MVRTTPNVVKMFLGVVSLRHPKRVLITACGATTPTHIVRDLCLLPTNHFKGAHNLYG